MVHHQKMSWLFKFFAGYQKLMKRQESVIQVDETSIDCLTFKKIWPTRGFCFIGAKRSSKRGQRDVGRGVTALPRLFSFAWKAKSRRVDPRSFFSPFEHIATVHPAERFITHVSVKIVGMYASLRAWFRIHTYIHTLELTNRRRARLLDARYH